MKKRIKQITKDGSYTLIDPDKNVRFHSIHGALQESNHVFIKAGLEYCLQNFPGETPLKIFETGFGTGLNALLTAMKAIDWNKNILYHSIEAYPLEKDEWESLEYDKRMGREEAKDVFEKMHGCEWNTEVDILPVFHLKKIRGSLLDFIPEEQYHLVYFDAFAPTAQPELWTREVFTRIAGAMMPGGALVTFCSKTIVRNAMKESGFQVNKLPGPPGKREMVRAVRL